MTLPIQPKKHDNDYLGHVDRNERSRPPNGDYDDFKKHLRRDTENDHSRPLPDDEEEAAKALATSIAKALSKKNKSLKNPPWAEDLEVSLDQKGHLVLGHIPPELLYLIADPSAQAKLEKVLKEHKLNVSLNLESLNGRALAALIQLKHLEADKVEQQRVFQKVAAVLDEESRKLEINKQKRLNDPLILAGSTLKKTKDGIELTRISAQLKALLANEESHKLFEEQMAKAKLNARLGDTANLNLFANLSGNAHIYIEQAQSLAKANPAWQQVLDQVTKGLTQIQKTDRTEFRMELKVPGFENATLTITEFNSARGEFNLLFAGLSEQAMRLLEQGKLQQMLKQNLIERGYTLQMVQTTQEKAEDFFTLQDKNANFSNNREDAQDQSGQREDRGRGTSPERLFAETERE